VRRFEDFQGAPRHNPPDPRQSAEKARRRIRARQGALRLTQKGLDLYRIVMAIVHWGDVYMAGKKGRPLVRTHDFCGKDFDPVMVCSECGEPLWPKRVHVHPGSGAKSLRHLPLDTDLLSARRVAKQRAAS
jgi:hypothetical protein